MDHERTNRHLKELPRRRPEPSTGRLLEKKEGAEAEKRPKGKLRKSASLYDKTAQFLLCCTKYCGLELAHKFVLLAFVKLGVNVHILGGLLRGLVYSVRTKGTGDRRGEKTTGSPYSAPLGVYEPFLCTAQGPDNFAARKDISGWPQILQPAHISHNHE